jgi:hypothetical protein
LLSESRSGVFSETHELTVAVLAIFCKVIELLKELRYSERTGHVSEDECFVQSIGKILRLERR